MGSKVKVPIILFIALTMGIVFGCSSSSNEPGTEAGVDPAAATLVTDVAEGRALYASKCVGCHGDIDSTDIATPTSFSDIRKAISGNRGGMGVYAAMSDDDVQALADAINTPGTLAPVPVRQRLYKPGSRRRQHLMAPPFMLLGVPRVMGSLLHQIKSGQPWKECKVQ